MGARAPCVSCMRAVPCGPQCPREILQELVAEVESRRERRTGRVCNGKSTEGVDCWRAEPEERRVAITAELCF